MVGIYTVTVFCIFITFLRIRYILMKVDRLKDFFKLFTIYIINSLFVNSNDVLTYENNCLCQNYTCVLNFNDRYLNV